MDWDALYEKVEQLCDTGEYEAALEVANQALDVAESLGDEEMIARSLFYMAYLNDVLESDELAAEFYRRSLQLFEQVDHEEGVESEDVALVAGNLGMIYKRQGKSKEAETLYERALFIMGDLHGSESAEYAKQLQNLADLYLGMKSFDQAEALLLRVLLIQERTLNKDDLEIAHTLCDLAEVYYQTEQFEKPERHYLRAIGVMEKNVEASDTELAMTLSNLAELYQVLERHDEAAGLYERVLGMEGVGKEVKAVAASNLGQVFFSQGRVHEGRSLMEGMLVALASEDETDGYLKTVVMKQLGFGLKMTGELEEAEGLYRRALGLREALIGREHLDIVPLLDDLGDLYVDQGRFSEAEAYFMRSLELNRKLRNAGDPEIGQSMKHLGENFFSLGAYRKAMEMYEGALEILVEVYGERHIDIAYLENGLGDVNHSLEKLDEAAAHYQKAIALCESLAGDDDEVIDEKFGGIGDVLASACNNLALVYGEWGRLVEAVVLMERAIAILERGTKDESESIKISLKNLVDLYEELGDVENAKAVKSRLDEVS
ncbi:photosystem I assembly protein Ycf3 [Poriferisphaera corsica]|uniref:Photosystem I assembly protein Ycf3 n=1 Tax=Poriferisphaera corsica TaxID=2528020 RepID=A0A517YWC4_9BACT|nr:tetratricopeptide repeat protein [Poriferisphaera corsica]QDU34524.1 photosystem I assembly protein Ycf3 [Poriferisphaera corsica]